MSDDIRHSTGGSVSNPEMMVQREVSVGTGSRLGDKEGFLCVTTPYTYAANFWFSNGHDGMAGLGKGKSRRKTVVFSL